MRTEEESAQEGWEDGGRVLVVDDNLQNRLVAEGHLMAFGYEVIMADSGPAALEAFARCAPDLVLLDVLMPGMDGLEVCRRIREMPGGLEVPICFLTALSDVGTYRQASEAGGDDYLSKPIRQAELLLRVRSLIRLRRLQRALEQRNAELLFEQEQRRRLAAMVVHDLKSPLAAQMLNCDYLASMDLPGDAAEAVADVMNAAAWMQRMLMELLDLERATDGALRPRRVEVLARTLLQDCVARLQPILSSSGQRVEIDVSPPSALLQVDVDLFQRVLANLLDNCAKYAPRDSIIRLEVSQQGGTCVLQVVDQGPGIPPEQRARIFEVYGQLDRSANRTSRGIGLAFCKLAVEAHDGTIQAVDSPGGGATFRIELPILDELPLLETPAPMERR